ncbi:GNAT family N-acetyltransferase [Limibacter armeniacum]|uniref:GNAT family N-acetyltransferase n=1 Tax=Limibacter armeniacum TaxID=466084 RepID=UPI002FE551AC
MNYTIRKPEASELQTIAQFQIDMAWETENLKLDTETVNKGVKHVFDHPQIGNYWVAEADNEVIACLLTVYEWSDWRNGNVLWIHSLYVKESYRKKGVFKSMYTYLKEMVEKSDEFRGIRLYVEKTNLNAQQVYEAIGMTKEHYELYEWLK